MGQMTVKPWHCKRCGQQLAVIEGNGRSPHLVFDSAMLPSLIRDHVAFVVVECPRCGESQRWYKREKVDFAAEP